MNKWQIICPIAAFLVVGLAIGIVHERGEQLSFIRVASRSIGNDLVISTNSSHLVHIGPNLQTRLSEFLGTRARVDNVLLGDEPPPFGDGKACSRVVLANSVGQSLLIRLRQSNQPNMFEVLGFRTFAR